MRRFSIGTSLGDGFRLLGRRPLAVFAWGLLIVAPMIAMFVAMLPALASISALSMEAGAETGEMPPELVAEMMQLQAASMLANLVQLLVMAVVYTAIMRAVLRPAEKSVFSLRIGMDEIRVAVVGLAIGVGLYVVIIMATLLGMGVGFAAWGSRMEAGPGVALAIVLFLVLLIALGWALGRVSLMAPATVLYRDFGFAQGWRLAAGKGWALFGLMVVILLLFLVFEIVIIMVTAALGASLVVVASNAGIDWSAADPFAEASAWLGANWYWGVVFVALAGLVAGAIATLSVAPFASACRQLADSGPRDEASPAPAA
ncbi:hypothetical protein [Brevundimonas sp. Root1279]|uniref:hypothetical protein n=1 Tax=Brevundimonas sp. Root1279 TaxID=1736443 RepID=UPI000AA5A90D|nr:hypothetical protein [Brevundimonas sp. Root1279]